MRPRTDLDARRQARQLPCIQWLYFSLHAIEGTYTPVGHAATQQAGSAGLTATEHRLDNGLRLVLSEDHLTPFAAVCLWYDVGSGQEVQGRTGLAHLFEHLMFQGSGQVKGNGHFELVQGAGGSLNGSTSFERTNYFETMPAHQLELALWLE
ncbi:MAG: M16 family metallopeptidase, partial [Streptosporangiaceae bacterium]